MAGGATAAAARWPRVCARASTLVCVCARLYSFFLTIGKKQAQQAQQAKQAKQQLE